MEKMKEAKELNIVMTNIASSLNYSKFDEVKDCTTIFDMWEKLQKIYRGDKNVQRAKAEILRDMFDHLKMKEGENISQSSERKKKE